MILKVPYCVKYIFWAFTIRNYLKGSVSMKTVLGLFHSVLEGRRSYCCLQQITKPGNESDPIFKLTAEFDADEVLDAQVLQEDPRGGRGFEQEGDVRVQLAVERGEVQVGRLPIEKRSVPEVPCQTNNSLLCVL